MAQSDHEQDEFHADLAQSRRDAAEHWDENLPLRDHPRDVVGDAEAQLVGEAEPRIVGGDRPSRGIVPQDTRHQVRGDEENTVLLGDAIEELSRGGAVGPYEFHGKSDYIRGETACLNGMNVIGAIPQMGSVTGNRMAVQMQGAGFVSRTMPGGKTYLAVRVKPVNIAQVRANLAKGQSLRVATALDAVKKAQFVAKNAKVVSASLRNFKSKAVVGSVDWVNIVGAEGVGDDAGGEVDEIVGRYLDDIVGGTELVGEAAAAFDDIGAASVRRRSVLPPDATVRKLAAELGTAASKLDSSASKFARDVNAVVAKEAAGVDKVRKIFPVSKGGVKVSAPTGVRVVGDDQPVDLPVPPPPAEMPTVDLPPGPPDYGVGPELTIESDEVKLRAGRDYDEGPPAETDKTDYTKMGDVGTGTLRGAIPYAGEMGTPTNAFGSFNMVYGPNRTQVGYGGYVFGGLPAHWLLEWNNNGLMEKKDPAEWNAGMDEQASSIARNFGPLVGNKGVPGFEGMRYGVKDGLPTYFWFWNEAPDWAKKSIMNERLQKAFVIYDALVLAAKTDYVNAVATAKSDKKEVDDRLRQTVRDQAKIQSDAMKFDASQAQLSAQLDMQYAQQQMQQEGQRSQLEMQQQSAETAAYEQRLKSGGMQQQMQQPQGGGGPFDDLQQGGYGGGEQELQQGGRGGGGDFDDLSPEEMVKSQSMMYDQPDWGDQ